jgi:hypothetical protein
LINTSTFKDCQIQYKHNLNESFERSVELFIQNKTDKQTAEDFFQGLVEVMRANSKDNIEGTDLQGERYFGPQLPDSDALTSVVLKQTVPENFEIQEQTIKEPFVPSPRTAGFCWSPQGYILHYTTSHIAGDYRTGVKLYSKNEIIKFINDSKESKDNDVKLRSEQKKNKRFILSLSRSDSSKSNSSDGFDKIDDIGLMDVKPIIFNPLDNDVIDINTSANIEETYKRGFFNKSNDALGPKNQLSLFVTNIGISYSFAMISTIDDDCIHNIEAAVKIKRTDLAKIWKMVSIRRFYICVRSCKFVCL